MLIKKLVVLIGLILAGALSHVPQPGAPKEPGGTPADHRMALEEPHNYAWKLFLFLNRQADTSGSPGQAHPDFTGPTDTPVVWETWASATGPGESQVFPNSADLPSWFSLKTSAGSTRDLVGDLGGRVEHFARTGIETRFNQAAYQTVQAGKLHRKSQLDRILIRGDKIKFPPSSKVVKAKWETINRNKRAQYHWRLIKGDYYGLVALHIMSKDIDNWFWATFAHVENESQSMLPYRDLSDDVARSATQRTKWENYRLIGVQTDFMSGGQPTRLGNEQIEGYPQTCMWNGREFRNCFSCMTCHSRATYGPDQLQAMDAVGAPDPGWFKSGTMETEFLFSIGAKAK